jgi:hypothetical protein
MSACHHSETHAAFSNSRFDDLLEVR